MKTPFRSAPPVTCGYWAPVAYYAALIWMLSSIPSVPDLLGDFPGQDKVLHMFEFAGLGWLLTLAFRRTTRQAARRYSWLVATLCVLMYGWLDEVHQVFVPGREVALSDFLADVCGGILGGIACLWYLKAAALRGRTRRATRHKK